MEVPDKIICVDCGGDCYRLTVPPEDGFTSGDIIAFRCADCLDRWDVEFADEDAGGHGDETTYG